MQLISPTGSNEPQHNCRAPRLESLDGLTIGLLTNGKVNADVLLEETAALFARNHKCRILPLAGKSNASAPASTALIDELAASADVLLTASGD